MWGPGWRDYLPKSAIGGDYLPNELLPQKYAEASVVLSDHFPDMARLGFINNRVFEAVATGARVISDQVAGLNDVFGDMVATYDSLDELRELFDHRASRFGGTAGAEQRATFVAEHHSFDARARQLVRYVRSLA